MNPVTPRQRSYMNVIAKALGITIYWNNIHTSWQASAWLQKYVPIFKNERNTDMTKAEASQINKGDRLLITNTNGHGFPMGTIVTVTSKVDRDGCLSAEDARGYSQYLELDNYEPFVDEPEPPAEADPNYIEYKPAFDEVYSGAYLTKLSSCEPARISASIAPKRSRSTNKVVASPPVL